MVHDTSFKWPINVLLYRYRAEVTVILEKIYIKIGSPELKTLDNTLKGPGGNPLGCKEHFVGYLQKGDLTIREEIDVIKNLHKPLLGRPAIRGLNLLKRLDSVKQEQSVLDQFSSIFEGLGKLKGYYTIKLQDNAKPFAVSTPRRVLVSLLEPVRKELDHTEKMGVISPIQEPMNWCTSIVPVQKKNRQVRICVDLTRLNESVKRELHPLPVVVHVLVQLAGAKVFSKLDANSGFYQILLDPRSAKLTTFLTSFDKCYYNRLPFGITVYVHT